MSEMIAEVVGDLAAGRFEDHYDVGTYGREMADIADSVVVDVTDLFNDALESSGMDLYEQLAAPPWRNALLCYKNTYENIVCLHVTATDVEDWDYRWEVEDQDHDIDWDAVRWVLSTTVWVGGRSQGHKVKTSGPMMVWSAAVNPDGVIQDVLWTDVSSLSSKEETLPMSTWDAALSVWLRSYNFLACRTVTAAEPIRSRAERRRIDRASGGVKIHELVVTPVGKGGGRKAQPLLASGTAAHSVRGHFSEYGSNGKGLLFGKLAGRFWVPQHARGSADHGEVVQRFTLALDKEN